MRVSTGRALAHPRYVGSVALVASALAFGAPLAIAAEGDSPSARFERIDPKTIGRTPGWKPASLDAKRRTTVILELAGAPVGKRQAEARKQGRQLSKAERAAIRAALKGQQDALKPSIEAAGGQVVADYQDAYNGIAVRAALKDLAALANLPGVIAVHPTRTFKPDNTAAAQYIGANSAWASTGFTGDGVKVAIIDSGVDYFHANFGGSGDPSDFANNNHVIVEPGSFPTAKVVGGTDLVGDDYDASSDDPVVATPAPDPDPVDCGGHGSHVAGSAAGFGVLSSGATYTGPYDGTTYSNSFRIGPGVAPKGLILAFRVFGCGGSTSEAVIVDAIDQAMAADADVINMSLGSPFGRTDEPSVVASNVAAEAGVVVVAAAGNEGPSGYMAGAPAIASRSISVAALDASRPTFPAANVALSTGSSIVAQNSNEAAFADGTTLPVKVLRNADGSVSLGCDPAEYVDVAGKLVVTVRGDCARVARAIHGEKAGAAAVAMINTAAGYPPFEGEITSDPDTGEQFTVTIPFLGVRGVLGPAATADGDNLVAADGGTATLTNTTVANPTYQRLAAFSSGGPRNVDSAVKPDVTAPGVSVISTGVGSGAGAATSSGTSMSSPMTAGVAALVSQARPTWSTENIKAAIMNTADASSAKILGYNVRTGGAGVVQPRKAVDTVAVATTSSGTGTLSFGYEPLAGAYSETLSLTLTNNGSSSIDYNLAGAFNGSAFGASIVVSPSSVTVPPGGSQTVDVTLSMSPAAISALPGMSTFTIGWGGVFTVRGAVIATPTSSGPGIYPLRVPFVVAPRGLSNVTAGPKSPYTKVEGSLYQASVPLANSGIHSGIADVYAWGIDDPDDIVGAEDGMDVRAVGVQALPGEVLGGAASDRSLFFAINVHGRWSNAAVTEFDIVIDSKGNDAPEFFVVGVDFGAVTAGVFDGRVASFIFNAAGELINAWVAENPMNGSTILLPTLASDIGLDAAVNSTKFRYRVNAFSIVPGALVDTTATGQFRSHQPPVSTGDFIPLAPGGAATLNLVLDKGKFAGTPVLGWIVATVDDANGGLQADTIPVGPLP